jgi:hypothetical protein
LVFRESSWNKEVKSGQLPSQISNGRGGANNEQDYWIGVVSGFGE